MNLYEHMNEQMSAEIWEASGGQQAATKLASSHDSPVTIMAQRHWGEQFDPDGKLVDPAKQMEYDDTAPLDPDTGRPSTFRLTKSVMNKIKKGPDAEVPLKMMVFDYLINNAADRHGLNILLDERKDGTMGFGVIDQGLAFEAGAVASDGKAHWDLPMDDFLNGIYRADRMGDEIADNDDTGGGWHISELVTHVAGDKKTLRKQLKSAADSFEISLSDIGEKMARRKVTREQAELLEQWLDEYDFRLSWLQDNLDHMVDVIAQRGGMT
jgi:hypothetical protein